MAPRLLPDTRLLLERQNDVVAAWQLSTPQRRSFRRGVRLKQLRELTPRVFYLGSGEPDQQDLMWAAALHCGPTARLGGQAALSLHGWNGDVAKPIDVVVPPHIQPQNTPPWIRVHRLASLGTSHLKPPRVPAGEAACQAGAWARTQREAIFVVVSALQQRLTTADRVLAAMTKTMRNHQIVKSALTEYRDGIQSIAEYDFGQLCHQYGLPAPTRQRPVRDSQGKIRSIDVEFQIEGRLLRVEVEGIHHLKPDAWLDDIDRHNNIVLAGSDAYLRVATITLRLNPAPFMNLLKRMVARLASANM